MAKKRIAFRGTAKHSDKHWSYTDCISLALMDSGIKIRKPVSGIAMGLIKEGERTVVLTDILGLEDHLGDMDFKVTGTEDGITAFQMDVKISGVSRDKPVVRRIVTSMPAICHQYPRA